LLEILNSSICPSKKWAVPGDVAPIFIV
jgi:hypothetical protein